MLKNIHNRAAITIPEKNIGEITFPDVQNGGLEYNPPSRGAWNIVHIGMLIPKAHQIYFCAQGCLRGVVQTTAEMNAADRLSWAYLCDEDYAEGSMEQNIIDSMTAVIRLMQEKPPCILMFLSCMHLFAGVDFGMIIDELSAAFPQIEFVDCYMTPTMRKSGLTPDMMMYRQLYRPLKKTALNEKSINIIGNNQSTLESSELLPILKNAGFLIRDITYCKTYAEYLKMAESSVNITYLPIAAAAGADLEERLGQKHLYLPLCYGFDEIRENYEKLCHCLDIDTPNLSEYFANAEKALTAAQEKVGNIAVAIDASATPRLLGLCRLLLEYGFNVTKVYTDGFSSEEKEDFFWLEKNAPQLKVCPIGNVSMRFASGEDNSGKILAVGQKAAYFCGTDNFVNIINGGELYGFGGIVKLCELLEDAIDKPKDRRTVIQMKGIGCESCL